MPTNIFVNLPVKDLNASIEFFTKLGYSFNPQFTNHEATCMVISENIYVMLLVHDKFKGFTPNPVADAFKTTEALICLSCESREHVKELIDKAVAAGAKTPLPANDYGFMYHQSYQDLDGHIWELMWMDPAMVQK